MSVHAPFVFLVAPLPFWLLGLPWCLGPDGTRMRLAPLIGCALAGFYAELALISSLPVSLFACLTMLASTAAIAIRRIRWALIKPALFEFLPVYWIAVLAASLSPFPVLGNWSGDWLLLYQMGQAVVTGSLPADMLARPPLFGAAATPLWMLGDGLISYQLMAAVASAAAVTCTARFIDSFWPRSPWIVLLPLLLSPLFLHHTAAAWAKLLAGGLILAAVTEGLQARHVASAALFSLAIAAHEGSILWAPCVLLVQLRTNPGWRGAVRSIVPMLCLGALIVGPLQVWILVKYGLAAKIAANPVITDRDHTPFLMKGILGVVSAFVGWGPISGVIRWAQRPHALSPAVVGKEGYWLITSWITTLAGTLGGFLLPFVFVRRALGRVTLPTALTTRWILAAVCLVIVLNSVLAGFYSNEGTMQNALVPLALGLYALVAGGLAAQGRDAGAQHGLDANDGGRRALRRVSWIMAGLGTLPWLVINIGTSSGFKLSEAYRLRFRTGSEGDYFRVIDNHLEPLGMAAFPQVPLLSLGLLVAWAIWRRRVAVRHPGGAAPRPI